MNFTRHTMAHNQLAAYCRSFGNASRVAIIEKIAESNTCIQGEMVQINALSDATVIGHLLSLKKEGIIKGGASRGSKNYCIDWDRLDEFKRLFDELYDRVKKHQEQVLCNNETCR